MKRIDAKNLTNARTSLIALLMAASLTACSTESGPDPIPEAQDPTTSVSPSAPKSSEPPDEPSWKANYSENELAAYDTALNRWAEYETKSEPIFAAGKATREAKDLFKKYWPSPAWQILYDQLKTYEQVEVKSEGLPTVLWSRAKKVTAKGSTGSVSLVQCVDYTTVSTTQYGNPVGRVKQFEKPVLRTIMLSRPKGYSWLIYAANEPTVSDFKRCAAEDSR